jgi:hypothetical protein
MSLLGVPGLSNLNALVKTLSENSDVIIAASAAAAAMGAFLIFRRNPSTQTSRNSSRLVQIIDRPIDIEYDTATGSEPIELRRLRSKKIE